MKKIRVRLKPQSYDVLVAPGLLRRVGRILRKLLPAPSSQVFLVTSERVRGHWGSELEKSLTQAGLSFHVLEMNDGEPAKRLETVERLAEQMMAAKADRKSLVLAFGGGVVGDCAGFLAAVFMRGVPVVQVPTTFLAQVDASIGGKTGVNLRAGKNLIGAFHQPLAVLIDPDVLATLSDREYRAGLFEALKCGVIRDKALFNYMADNADKILERDSKALRRIIADSIRVKAKVVSADEKESGLRRVLNFGHTVGHALESATGYSHLLHGEAVAWGMIAAADIAGEAGFCSFETTQEIQSAVFAYGPLPPVKCSVEDILKRLGSDKKAVAGEVHFVLPLRIGKVEVSADVPEDVVEDAVKQITAARQAAQHAQAGKDA